MTMSHIKMLRLVTVLVSLFSLVVTPPATAKEINIEVTSTPFQFEVTSRICLPSSTKKAVHQQLTKKAIKQYIINNVNELATNAEQSWSVTEEQALQATLNVALLAEQRQLASKFDRLGNELCSESVNTFSQTNQPLLSEIHFSKPKKYHWLASNTAHLKKAIDVITQRNWPVIQEFINPSSTPVMQLTKDNQQVYYFLFDAERYLSLIKDRNKQVFVAAGDEYKAALTHYFSTNGFSIIEDPKDAFWHLSFDITPSSNGLDLAVTAQSKEQTLRLNNLTTTQAFEITEQPMSAQTKNKLIGVYLEMMELRSQLLFQYSAH